MSNKNFINFSHKQKSDLIILFFFSSIFISLNAINDLYSNSDENLIKVGYYCNSIKYGGVERVVSLLLHYLSKEKIFSHYLITKQDILEGEYPIPANIKRISLSEKKISLFSFLRKKHLDILIYNFYDFKEIKKLNRLKTTKIIYYNHSSFLLWIYQKNYIFKKTVYYIYKKCNLVISLIPVENDYLFKIWGINSIFMHNPSSFEYVSVIPSDLSTKNIIMIGRAGDKIKRYELGIRAMKNIIKEIPLCKMNIVSVSTEIHESLIKELNLEKNVRFVGFQKNTEIYLKNSSLHIMPSLSESYPMVLGETKIFGIPSIICGLDYLALAKKGTIIIFDDNPDTIAKEAIKILKNTSYLKKLGKEARDSMKKIKNHLIIKKWVKLLLSVYKGEKKLLFDNDDKISESEANKILNNQLKLLQKRNLFFKQLTLEKLKSYSLQ